MAAHVIQIGQWNFEVESVQARKAKKFGDTFTGVAGIRIIDGVAHVKALLTKGFTKQDHASFKQYLYKELGISDVVYERYDEQNKKRIIKKRQKNYSTID